MRWHVNCCIWLILLTILVCGNRITDTKRPIKRSIQFDEVADFADVVEPESKANKLRDDTVESVRRVVRPSLFKRSDFGQNELDASTLKVGQETLQNSDVKNGINVELAIKGADDSKMEAAPKKRSVSRKYANLLDLKYHYARGLPLKGRFVHSLEPNTKKRFSIPTGRNRGESVDAEKGGVKAKRESHLNILPIISAQNPYMSGLADATNDAYLKMRNYAATLMVILTSTMKPNLKVSERTLTSTPTTQIGETTRDLPAHVIKYSSSSDKAEPSKHGDSDTTTEAKGKQYKKRKSTRFDQKEAPHDKSKKGRKVKKDLLDFPNQINEPSAFTIVNTIPVLNTLPIANAVPVINNVPVLNTAPMLNTVAVTNPAGLVKVIPLQTVPTQNDMPTITNVRQSNDNANLLAKSGTVPRARIPLQSQNIPKNLKKGITPFNGDRQHLLMLKQNATSKKQRLSKNEEKLTTENPFLWENNLLREANIKVKRISGPEETVIGNQGKVSDDARKEIPIVTESNDVEISSKVLTPSMNNSGTAPSCIMNKQQQPESDDEQCNEEEEDSEEDCGTGDSVNNTCGGFSPAGTDQKRRRRQANIEDNQQVGVGFKEFTLPTRSISTRHPRYKRSHAKVGRTNHNHPVTKRKPEMKNKLNTTTHLRKESAKNNGGKFKKRAQCVPFDLFSTSTQSNTQQTQHNEAVDNLEKVTGTKVFLVTLNTDFAQLKAIPTLSFNAKALGHSHKTGKTFSKSSTSRTKSSTEESSVKKAPTIHADENAKKHTFSTSKSVATPPHEITTLSFDAKRLGHSKLGKNKSSGSKSSSSKSGKSKSHTSKARTSKSPIKDLQKVPLFIPEKDNKKIVLHSKKTKPVKEKPALGLLVAGLQSTTSDSAAASPSTSVPTNSEPSIIETPPPDNVVKPITHTYTYTTECIVVVKNIEPIDFTNKERRTNKLKKKELKIL